LAPKVYWLFYGKTLSGDTELLFMNIIRALGLVQGEWEWREPGNTKAPDTPLPCIAFAFGADAAQLLSGEREPLENLRDVVLELGGLDIPLVASFDLSHLLQKPNDKALAWQDLLLARSVLQSL
jgi:DNA polymerase